MSTTLYVTAGATFFDSTTAPDWLSTSKYKQGDIVAHCGLVYRAVRTPGEYSYPTDTTRTWMPIDFAAMPYRPSGEYREGACIYSTATGDVWRMYEDGEWGSFATIPADTLAELRSEIMRQSTTWQEAMD